jgi:hypothetical protein
VKEEDLAHSSIKTSNRAQATANRPATKISTSAARNQDNILDGESNEPKK